MATVKPSLREGKSVLLGSAAGGDGARGRGGGREEERLCCLEGTLSWESLGRWRGGGTGELIQETALASKSKLPATGERPSKPRKLPAHLHSGGPALPE